MIVAGIDIGTNTIRLLVAEVDDDGHRQLYSGRIVTRLGQNLDRTGLLSEEAQERSISALSEFSGVLRVFSGCPIAAFGTSALRNARNAASFVAAAKERTGLTVGVISGDEEARLTLEGVRRALSRGKRPERDPLQSALVVDIGGGSSELIITRQGTPVSIVSLSLGAVYLTERFLHRDPPAKEELQALQREIMLNLDAWEIDLRRMRSTLAARVPVLAGTAGTITTLASMDLGLAAYDPERINGSVLTRASLGRMIDRLASTSIEERKKIPGLDPGREDILLAGAMVAGEVMARSGKEEMIVSDWGLREGIVFDLYERTRARSCLRGVG